MGYTNYWKQSTDFTVDEWCAVKNEAEYLKNIGSNFNVGIYKDEIIINGNNEGCESFDLNRKARTEADRKYKEQQLDLHFCKTRELPYDLAVWHLLTFCQMIKKDFECSRDGWAWEKNPQPSDDVSFNELKVQLRSYDGHEDCLKFSNIDHYELIGEDKLLGNNKKSVWVRFKMWKHKNLKQSGFITSKDNVINFDQIQDNLIMRVR